MTPPTPTLVLPRGTGGLNRFDNEAQPEQLIEASNVYHLDGRLVRRPALKPIAHGVPFFLPAGMTRVLFDDLANTYSEYAHRVGTLYPNAIGGGQDGRLWIGCAEPFDGFHVNVGTITLDNLKRSAFVLPQYADADGVLHPIYDPTDTTRKRYGNFVVPFAKPGSVSWYRGNFPSAASWAPFRINGLTLYWIALDISSTPPAPDVAASPFCIDADSGTIHILAPGFRVFTLEPINGLVSTKVRGGRSRVVIGSDRQLGVGLAEQGGALGFMRSSTEDVDPARIVEFEGEGVMSKVEWPDWTGGNVTGGVGSFVGTSDTVTRLDDGPDWMPMDTLGSGEFGVGVLFSGTTGGASTTTKADITGLAGFNLRGLYLYAGTNYPREIVSTDLGGVTVSDPWAAAPNGVAFFIAPPPCRFKTLQGPVGYDHGIAANYLRDLTPSSSYDEFPLTAETGIFVHMEIFRPFRWTVPAGARWSTCYDPVTGRLLITNGRSGILEFDGRRVRRLAALWDDTEGVPGSAAVRLWRGILADQALALNKIDVTPGSILYREPPNARVLADFQGRIVAIDADDSIRWSAPGADNNIWPYLYQTILRDTENNPPTGLRSAGSLLYAWTKTAIFAAEAPGDDGLIIFRPVVQGQGFAANDSVVAVGNILIGPTPDGLISIFNGQVTRLIDEWHRVIDGGINPRALAGACAAHWPHHGLYLLALPSGGSSVNDVLLVYEIESKKFWTWTMPYGGCAAICRQLDQAGEDRILFGLQSGHVAEMVWQLTEGGQDITGRIRSKTIEPLAGRTFGAVGVQLSMLQFDGLATLEMFTNQKRCYDATDTVTFASGSVFNAGVYGTKAFAGGGFSTHRAPAPAGAVIGESFGFAVSCTAPFSFQLARLLFGEKGDRAW